MLTALLDFMKDGWFLARRGGVGLCGGGGGVNEDAGSGEMLELG